MRLSPLLLAVVALLTRPVLAAPYTWKSVTIGGGGYVTDVYCHPAVRDLVYIRTDVGGFYRWDPAGDRWIPLSEQFAVAQSNYYGGEGLALDPADPNLVYIAAGRYGWSTLPGTIFKSRDRGRTWTKLPIDLKMGGNEDWRWLGPRLVVSPFSPRVLLFGSRHDGLWRSADAGASWSRVASLPATLKDGAGITSLAFALRPKGRAFAAAFGDGVYQSDDDGATWCRLNGSPSEPQRMAAASDGALFVTTSKGVARLANGDWTDVTPAGVTGSWGGVSVNPRDPQDILIAGQQPDLTLYRTRDGGASWSRKKTETGSSVPWYGGHMKRIQYVAGLTFDPQVAGRVWLTDWYATYRTENIEADPAVFANHERGHEELVAFSLAAPSAGMPLLTGVADVDGFAHMALDEFPTHGYGDAYGGTGPSYGDTDQIAWCAAQPLRLARVGVKRWENTGWGSTSADGGQTWTAFPSWDQKVMAGRIAMAATDPGNMLVLRVGAGPAQYTKDGGGTWQAVAGLPDKLVPDVWFWQAPLAADGAKAGVFYVFKGGTLLRSTDGGATFTPAATGLPGGSQTILQSVPGKSGELWLALGDAGLYHSVDSGATFRHVAGVKQADLFAAGKPAAGSTQPALYVLGTLTAGWPGIFRSTDGGAAWEPIQDPAMPIGCEPNSMAASWRTAGLVFVGTNGRGVYYGVPTGTVVPAADLPKAGAGEAAKPAEKPAEKAAGQPRGFPNGDMSQGGAAPDGWAINWKGAGTLELVRDTKTFKGAPASLSLRSSGGPAVGGASHGLQVTTTPFTLTGFVRAEGQLKSSLLAVQVFDGAWKQIDWFNIAMPKAGTGWQEFATKVKLPVQAANAQLVLTLDGDAQVWLDEVSLVADQATLQTEAQPLPVAVPPTDPRIRYVGRFDTADPAGPRCSWSASAVRLRAQSTAVNVKLNESGDSDRYQIVVDGKVAGLLAPKGGSHLYRVLTDPAGAAHTLELVKRTEGFFGVSRFEGFQLASGGKLLALPAGQKRGIEVVGDSISCGYGNEAPNQNEHFSPDTENAYMSYGAIAARALGADYTCVAWSGRCMWPKNTMDEVYGRVLAQDAGSAWDFRRWTPDAVIITLGTNDFAGGTPDRAGWIAGYRVFIARVRKNYPKAAIYCATSPMMFGDAYKTHQSYLEQIIAEEKAAGNTNVRLLPFATQEGNLGFGADWHPNVKNQQIMGDLLAKTLEKDLGWNPARQ